MKNSFSISIGKAFVILLVTLCTGKTFSQGINFEHDTSLAAVKAKARAANKPIFIDCYTTWCGPCKWMAKNIFPNDTVGEFFNKNFVSLKMDMEKGDGKRVSAHYKISFYPTLLFLDSTGKEMHRVIGAQKNSELIASGKKALDPKTQFSNLKEKYRKGCRDEAFLRQYLVAANAAGEPNVAEMADWYFAFLPAEHLVTDENFLVIENTVFDMHQPGFEKLYQNREKFMAVVGRDRVNVRIKQVVERKFSEAFQWNLDRQRYLVNEEKYTEVLARVNTMEFEGRDEVLSLQNLRYHQGREDQAAYMKALKEHIARYLWNNSDQLNAYAWEIYEITDKKEDLELALTWAGRSVELSDECYNNDTYAAICQKLKRKKEALRYAQKALNMAKKEGVDTSDYVERLEAIKKCR